MKSLFKRILGLLIICIPVSAILYSVYTVYKNPTLIVDIAVIVTICILIRALYGIGKWLLK